MLCIETLVECGTTLVLTNSDALDQGVQNVLPLDQHFSTLATLRSGDFNFQNSSTGMLAGELWELKATSCRVAAKFENIGLDLTHIEVERVVRNSLQLSVFPLAHHCCCFFFLPFCYP